MMLTAIPPRLLHRVRDAAAYVHDLAELGLALLCPCDDTHGLAMRQLAGDEAREPRARCADNPDHYADSHAPGGAWYGVSCAPGAEFAIPAERPAGMARLDVTA